MTALLVLRLEVAMAAFEAAEEDYDGPLYRALTAVEWVSQDRSDDVFTVLADRAAAPLREALAGRTDWREVDITDGYVLGRTRSERPYDGFGTRELTRADAHGWRTVAVRREHLEWQTTRYETWENLT